MNSSRRFAARCTLQFAVAFAFPIWADAQFVNDGATNTLANVTNSITGDVTVGTNGSFTLLVLASDSLLTNSGNALIGRNLTARSNEVRLVSPTARWQVGGSLFVGSNGAANRLIVSNAATLDNNSGVIGSRIDSSNNVALITGGGSLWSNRNDLDIGIIGRGNQMLVSAGGWVVNRNARLGGNASGSNNFVRVTGAGSVWSNALSLTVGNAARGSMIVESGGLVHDDSGTVGGFGTAANSEVLVTGAGSVWNNASFLTLGNNVGFNRLIVSNGAIVRSGSSVVGATSTSSSNQVLVTGDGSLWTNQATLSLGSSSAGNSIEVRTGGWLASQDGDIGGGVNGNSNLVTLHGLNSGWLNRGGLILGGAGGGNMLVLSNGATVLSSNTTLGVNGGTANNNIALLTGAGTLWSNQNDFVVGSASSANRLQVENGATVQSGNLIIGFDSSALGNRVVVNGGTLRATNASGTATLDVRHGTNVFNAGLIEVDWLPLTNSDGFFEFNGGRLVTRGGTMNRPSLTTFYVGTAAGSSPAIWDMRAGPNNTELNGSIFTIVGRDSSWNQILVTNGAMVQSGNLALGEYPTAQSNSVVLAGGSQWQMGNTTIGGTGACNQVVLSGGAVLSSDLSLRIGHSSRSNQLMIVGEGGLVNKTSVVLGLLPASGDNALIVTGLDAFCFLNELRVGDSGGGNRLVVSNGASLAADSVYLGKLSSSTGNRVLVSGAGTSLYTTNLLLVGASDGNILEISGGGYVGSWAASVGSGANDNQVLVAGAGSVWSNTTPVLVGEVGSNNRLTVTDAGWLIAAGGVLGFGPNATNNQVIVSGSGSVWSNRANLTIGDAGGGNHVIVSNAALVVAGDVFIGVGSNSTNNTLIVDGGTLRVTNSTGSGVLHVLRGTNALNSGTMDLTRLSVTNVLGQFEFNGGRLVTSGTTVANGRPFATGNGSATAALELRGGAHTFQNNIAVANHSLLAGDGTVAGVLTIQPGGLLSPGAPLGTLVLNNSPILLGATTMEISKSGMTRTNDRIQVAGPLTYGGTLTVSNLGPTLLTLGDRFQLFSASGYAGGFSSLNLPPLPSGLEWANKLSLDGSIEVVTGHPRFATVSLSGTNIVLFGVDGAPGAGYTMLTATNVTTPTANWLVLFTNQFNGSGQFSFSNSINPNEPQRYFRLRTP